MEKIDFNIPHKIITGFSACRNLAQILQEKKIGKVLVVVDHNLQKKGIINHILEEFELKKIDFEIYDEIKREPTLLEAKEAIEKLDVANNYHAIIGIGGGSTLDVAKLLTVSEEVKSNLEDFFFKKTIEEKGLFSIMVPSTAGTGSEATPNVILKDEKEKTKKGIISNKLIPDLVILDPEITLSLPSQITAHTGIDALTHSLECYIGKKSNIMSDLYALESIKLICQNFRDVVKDGDNINARGKMLLGSFYGGVAITNSGTGAVHALAYPLGGKYNISHGLSNAVLLVEVMKYNSKAVPKKFVNIADAIGADITSMSNEEAINYSIREIRSIVDDADIKKLELDLTDELLDELTNLALTQERLLSNNPTDLRYEDVIGIYRKSLFK